MRHNSSRLSPSLPQIWRLQSSVSDIWSSSANWGIRSHGGHRMDQIE